MRSQILSLVAAVNLVGFASTTPIPQAVPPPAGHFNFSDFRIAAIPHSIQTYYEFNIADYSATLSNFTTRCCVSTPTGPAIGNITKAACNDPSVTFSFVDNGQSRVLEVFHNWGVALQGPLNLRYENVTDFAYRFFPDSTIINNPSNPVGYYSAYLDAPTSFEENYRRNAV